LACRICPSSCFSSTCCFSWRNLQGGGRAVNPLLNGCPHGLKTCQVWP
jgi:hypothetical protein